MKLITDNTDAHLVGYGLGAALFMIIILGVERFNGPPPEYATLTLLTGQTVDIYISKSRDRIFADVRVRSGQNDIILFQQVPERLAAIVAETPAGATVSALILSRKFTDSRTGLPRHSMWQLSVNGNPIFSYNEVVQFHVAEIARWRIVVYCLACVAVACFAGYAIRRYRRAAP